MFNMIYKPYENPEKSIKGALRSFGEEILIRGERSCLTDFVLCLKKLNR